MEVYQALFGKPSGSSLDSDPKERREARILAGRNVIRRHASPQADSQAAAGPIACEYTLNLEHAMKREFLMSMCVAAALLSACGQRDDTQATDSETGSRIEPVDPAGGPANETETVPGTTTTPATPATPPETPPDTATEPPPPQDGG